MFFAILMGISRMFYAKFGNKIKLEQFMMLSGILCVISYLLAALAPVRVISFLGCGLCGLSVGVLWPGTVSLSAKTIPSGGTAMFALLALFGDVGCSAGPTIVGVASQVMGGELKFGLLVSILFPVLLIISILLLKKLAKS